MTRSFFLGRGWQPISLSLWERTKGESLRELNPPLTPLSERGDEEPSHSCHLELHSERINSHHTWR